MIKLSDIKAEIKEATADLTKEYKKSSSKEATANRLKKKIQFLNLCKKYIESSPSSEFIDKEILRLENRINLLSADFVEPENVDKKTLAKLKSAYGSEMGIPKLRVQLRTLRYLAK